MQKIKIILTDDDIDEYEFFKDALDSLDFDYELLYKKNALALIQHLSKENIPLPDIIFLDMCMPMMDGIECLQIIRNNSDLMNLKIVAYSNSQLTLDQQNAIAAGANSYMPKPASFNGMKSAIKDVLEVEMQ